MPATASPYGLSLVEYKGGKFRAAVSQYYLASGYATSLGRGDLVGLTAGNVIQYANAGAGNANPLALGVFTAVNYTNNQGNSVLGSYWPATTVTQNAAPALVTVNDLPFCVFQIQTDATAGGLTSASIGKNAIINVTAPNPTTSQSTMSLNFASITGAAANNATYPLKIVGLADPAVGSTNNWTDAYVDLLVIINNHVYRGGTAGIA